MQTRMQILNPTPSAVYHGMIHGTYRIASGEGILSLWRGMSSVVVGAGWSPRGGWPRELQILIIGLGPAHAVYFATYEAVKHVMGGNQAGVHHPLAAGRCWRPVSKIELTFTQPRAELAQQLPVMLS
jgi:hypothetical protein